MNLSTLSKLTETEARELLEKLRWPNGVTCPHCGGTDRLARLKGKAHRVGVWKCYDCSEQFSATVNTVMESSHLPIRIWLMAFSIMCSAKKSISAKQLQRQLGLGSYRTAWHLNHRIRHAMSRDPLKGLLGGVVMVDETYVGGKPKNMHRSKANAKRGRGTNKTPVVALVERGGRIRAHSIPDVSANTLHAVIRQNVEGSSAIQTDEWAGYRGIGQHFEGGHERVNHSRGEYVRGSVSTNEAESFFALLKRGITGSFHSVSKKHLDRYVGEFAYRWNWRTFSDADRTENAIRCIEGKRLTYKTPVGNQRGV